MPRPAFNSQTRRPLVGATGRPMAGCCCAPGNPCLCDVSTIRVTISGHVACPGTYAANGSYTATRAVRPPCQWEFTDGHAQGIVFQGGDGVWSVNVGTETIGFEGQGFTTVFSGSPTVKHYCCKPTVTIPNGIQSATCGGGVATLTLNPAPNDPCTCDDCCHRLVTDMTVSDGSNPPLTFNITADQFWHCKWIGGVSLNLTPLLVPPTIRDINSTVERFGDRWVWLITDQISHEATVTSTCRYRYETTATNGVCPPLNSTWVRTSSSCSPSLPATFTVTCGDPSEECGGTCDLCCRIQRFTFTGGTPLSGHWVEMQNIAAAGQPCAWQFYNSDVGATATLECANNVYTLAVTYLGTGYTFLADVDGDNCPPRTAAAWSESNGITISASACACPTDCTTCADDGVAVISGSTGGSAAYDGTWLLTKPGPASLCSWNGADGGRAQEVSCPGAGKWRFRTYTDGAPPPGGAYNEWEADVTAGGCPFGLTWTLTHTGLGGTAGTLTFDPV